MNKLFVRVLFTSLSCAVSAASILACSDDDGTAAPVTAVEAGKDSTAVDNLPGSLTGNATYAGTAKGPLYLTLYPSLPPVGNPSGIGAVNSPTWPGSNAYGIANVDPGRYFVLSYISVGSDHNMGPQPGDPVSQPVPVTITSGGQAKQDIVLADQNTDAGADASADAPSDAPDGG